MKRSRGDCELPGFYRDPRTGRYFKVPVSGSSLQSLINGSRVGATSEDFNTRRRRIVDEHSSPRFKSILNCLSSNQMGSIESLNYQQKISALRMENLHLAHQYIYSSANAGLKIRALKGGINHLYGQWVSPRNETIFYAFGDFTEAQRYLIGYCSNKTIVVDFCEGFSHPMCVLFVGNDVTRGLGSAELICRQENNSNAARSQRVGLRLNTTVWCCCSNRYSGLFALGGENGLYVHSFETHFSTKHFEGQVLGVHFKKTGEIVYAGVNNGRLITVDLRVHNPVCETKLNDYALTEIILLNNENYMICAGLGNFLAQVDVRMQRKTVIYLEEFRNTFKNPFSFNETHNILCSTGSDSVTRLWSLRGGRPLKTIPPPIPGEECRSWLMDDTSTKMSLYVASKNMVHVHEC